MDSESGFLYLGRLVGRSGMVGVEVVLEMVEEWGVGDGSVCYSVEGFR